MTVSSAEFHEESFSIMKHDDDDYEEKFFAKLLSKGTSKSPAASFRVYYGDVSSSIPFMWEIIPGTPKQKSFENSDIPPLTPPPSYYTSGPVNSSCTKIRSRSKLQLLHTLLRRINPKKVRVACSPPSVSNSSSSSLSWSPSYAEKKRAYEHRRRRTFSSSCSSFDERAMIDHSEGMGVSKMCVCGIGKGNGEKIHYSSVLIVVKKALLSIVGRGSD